MIKITMYSKADSVAGQGVGSAYLELMQLLQKQLSDQFTIRVNAFDKSDISHYHTINPSFYLSTFSQRRGQKIGYVHFLPETLEGSIKLPKPIKWLFYKYVIAFYKRMDHLVVVNPSFIDKLAAYGIDPAMVSYIPNFVDDEQFHPVAEAKRTQLRQSLGVTESQLMVFGSGQVQERKGVMDFVQLAKQNPTIRFIWAGGFSFGAITDGYHELKQVVEHPPANLTFTGIVSRARINELLNAADLFLLPSFNELFPMSVLEAFSTGTPVMLRDLSLYHAIIEGDYLPAADVAEMQTLLTQLEANPALLVPYQELSLATAQRYSKARLASIWQTFYQTQAQQRGKQHD